MQAPTSKPTRRWRWRWRARPARRQGGRSPTERSRAGSPAFAGRGGSSGWAADLLLDCAHNPEGARALAAALPALASGRRLVLVVSIVGDKDRGRDAGGLAPVAAAVVATRSDSPRALAPDGLAETARRHVADTVACDDPAAALDEARRRAGPGGLVVVCGSMFLVGQLRARVLGEPVDPLPTSDPVQRMSSSST